MNLDLLLDAIRRRSGLDRSAALHAAHATLTVLAERLIVADRHDLAAVLPAELGLEVDATEVFVQYGLEGFYDRVHRRLGGPRGAAIEQAQVVCLALASQLAPELAARLRHHLPAEVAALLAPVAEAAALPPRHPYAGGHTLADARPGSHVPVSESAPPRAQSGSVVQSENPHDVGKLSSAVGDLRHDLAQGQPGSERPISSTHD